MPNVEKGKKGKGGKRKLGRDKAKCERYRLSKRREKAKVKRVLISSGLNAAKQYALDNNVSAHLQKLLAEREQAHA